MKLNIGCGEDYRDGWVNVDAVDVCHYNEQSKSQKVDLVFDVRNNWPIEDNVADYILMQEIFEHVNRWDGIHLLKESYRVLKKNGELELTVPPAEKQMKLFLAFMNKPTSIYEFENAHQLPYNCWKALDDIAGATVKSSAQNGNDFMSHKAFYSSIMIKSLLEGYGFSIFKIDNSIRVFARKI